MDRQELGIQEDSDRRKNWRKISEGSMRIPLNQRDPGKDQSGKGGVILGDRDLLLSLLYNLLDNAVKAVEEGGFILMKGSKLTQDYERSRL